MDGRRDESRRTKSFPNKEVEEGFFDFLLPYYASVADGETSFPSAN
jgi:hypothetical protein